MVNRRTAGWGDKVEHGEVEQVTYDRPYRTYYNPYGQSAYMPADPVQMMLLAEGGWTIFKPINPLPAPKSVRTRDGGEFSFDVTGQDLSESERNRLNNRDKVTPQVVQQVAQAPTATYYTPTGTALHNLPADAENMKQYLAAGLSLDPPAGITGNDADAEDTSAVLETTLEEG